MSDENTSNTKELSGSIIKYKDTKLEDHSNISLDVWAEKNLSDDDYYLFLEAKARQDAISENAIQSGIMEIVPVTEEIYSEILKIYIPVQIGIKIVVQEGQTVPLDPEYMRFETMYAKDPAVNYRPTV